MAVTGQTTGGGSVLGRHLQGPPVGTGQPLCQGPEATTPWSTLQLCDLLSARRVSLVLQMGNSPPKSFIGLAGGMPEPGAALPTGDMAFG